MLQTALILCKACQLMEERCRLIRLMVDSVFQTQMEATAKRMETILGETLKLQLDSNRCHQLSNKKEKYQSEIEELFSAQIILLAALLLNNNDMIYILNK